MMQAGRLNRRCTLQAPGTTTDELGQPIPGWTDVATVWGDIRMKSGLESIKAGAPVSVVQASIRIRYRAGAPPPSRARAVSDRVRGAGMTVGLFVMHCAAWWLALCSCWMPPQEPTQ